MSGDEASVKHARCLRRGGRRPLASRREHNGEAANRRRRRRGPHPRRRARIPRGRGFRGRARRRRQRGTPRRTGMPARSGRARRDDAGSRRRGSAPATANGVRRLRHHADRAGRGGRQARRARGRRRRLRDQTVQPSGARRSHQGRAAARSRPRTRSTRRGAAHVRRSHDRSRAPGSDARRRARRAERAGVRSPGRAWRERPVACSAAVNCSSKCGASTSSATSASSTSTFAASARRSEIRPTHRASSVPSGASATDSSVSRNEAPPPPRRSAVRFLRARGHRRHGGARADVRDPCADAVRRPDPRSRRVGTHRDRVTPSVRERALEHLADRARGERGRGGTRHRVRHPPDPSARSPRCAGPPVGSQPVATTNASPSRPRWSWPRSRAM